MAKQGRSTSGKFAAKSSERRSVRTMRLTDAVWEKLGEVADKQGVTRADLVEQWANQELQHPNQLDIFEQSQIKQVNNSELITADTRKTGTELAYRLRLSSGAITNWYRDGVVQKKTKEHDPDKIAWERVPGGRHYRPVL